MLDEDLASDSFASPPCLTIKTGRADCYARFYPSLYQLRLETNGVEEKIDLGFSGSRLLERLAQVPGDVVAREELMSHAWSGRVVGQGSLNQQIHTLRQVLGDERERTIIQTLPRRGYLLNPQHLIAPESPPANARPQTEPEPPPANGQLQVEPESPLADVQPQAEPESPPTIAPPQAEPVSANPPATEEPVRTQQPDRGSNRGLVVLSLMAWMLVLLFWSVAHSDGPGPLQGEVVQSGRLMVSYPDRQHPEQVAQLKSQTQGLTTRLEKLIDQPTWLFVFLRGEFYKFACMQADGRIRSLVVHQGQLKHVADEQLQWCLPRMDTL